MAELTPTLIGGLGDDIYVVDLNDVVIENANEGTDMVDSSSIPARGQR